MACLKEEFKSRTRINKFNIKKNHFLSLVYGWKYSKKKMGFSLVLIEKNLIKFIKWFAICQNKLANVAVVKIVIFVTKFKFSYKQYMYYIDKPKIILWKIYLKTNEYGFELKHIIWKI